MKTLTLLIALAFPAAAFAATQTAWIGHGVPLQGDCKDGVKSPGHGYSDKHDYGHEFGHHKENDGRPKHGDGCRR